MIRRNIEKRVRQALADPPGVLLNGARQTGKTTLVQAVAADAGTRYLTLEDATTLALAVGERFAAGVVLHPGEDVVPAGDRLWLVPMHGLWSG